MDERLLCTERGVEQGLGAMRVRTNAVRDVQCDGDTEPLDVVGKRVRPLCLYQR